MSTPAIPSTIQALLEDFAPCFTRPGFKNFVTLISGWITCQGRRSISRIIQAAHGLDDGKHHSRFYRFFTQGRWTTDSVGKILFQRLLPWLPKKITLILDDTLSHRSGPHIFGAAMHYDAHKSTYGQGTTGGGKGFFAYGHNWVVAAVWLPLPWNHARGLAIPILSRLYRSKKRCPQKMYRKRTELASELVRIVESWLPAGRKLLVTGDSEYACKTLVHPLPEDVHFTGPMSMDAALYEPAEPYQGMGRPRHKGQRLPSPKELVASRSIPWKLLTLSIYGKDVTVKIKSMRCLWYTVAGKRIVRMIVTRDPTGRINDRAYFSTEAAISEGDILVQFARRWEIEVAFRNTKQAMGLEDPQNGWWRRKRNSPRPKKKPGPNPKGRVGEKAINHTLTIVFASYAITVLWYLQHGKPKDDVARVKKQAPWYQHKKTPSFTDMLAAVRREIWKTRLSQYPVIALGREKLHEILPHWLIAA